LIADEKQHSLFSHRNSVAKIAPEYEVKMKNEIQRPFKDERDEQIDTHSSNAFRISMQIAFFPLYRQSFYS